MVRALLDQVHNLDPVIVPFFTERLELFLRGKKLKERTKKKKRTETGEEVAGEYEYEEDEYDDPLPIDVALCVRASDKGGAPLLHNAPAVAAVDILLRDYAGLSKAAAMAWIRQFVRVSESTVVRARNDFDDQERCGGRMRGSLGLSDLLCMAGPYRHIVGDHPGVAAAYANALAQDPANF